MVKYSSFRDTAGQEEYARLRPLAYSSADIFLITFAINEKSSFVNAVKKVILNQCSGILKFILLQQMLFLLLLATK